MTKPVGEKTADKTEDKKTSASAPETAAPDPHYARVGANNDLSSFVTYGGYKESEDHVPDPHFQYGTLDTSDTAGAANQNIREISPVFDIGIAQALALSVRALDPKDTAVDPSVVSLPAEVLTADKAREDILARADALGKEPIVIGGMTPEQRVAATDADGNIPDAPKGEDAVEEKPSEKK